MHTEKSECCGGWLASWKSLLVVVVLASLLAGSWSCNRSSKMVQNGPRSERPAEDKAETEHAKNRQPSKTDETKPIDLDTPGPSTQRGRELYAQHCVACHGADGDGKGIAARFLFPKPRDLRAARFRLVSTTNYVSTKEDLHAVLVRGMPGSAMPPWAHLSEGDRNLLVEEVFRLRRDGAREQYIKILKEQEELTDEELAEEDVQQEITDFVESRSIPGESTKVPDVSEPNEESIARGKEIYLKLSCHSCHGEGGKGDGVQKMVDSEGYPTTPRDYTVGIFKGGHDPASLYRRIAYGMPGTPMPSTSDNLATPEQLVDLVHFIRSL